MRLRSHASENTVEISSLAVSITLDVPREGQAKSHRNFSDQTPQAAATTSLETHKVCIILSSHLSTPAQTKYHDTENLSENTEKAPPMHLSLSGLLPRHRKNTLKVHKTQKKHGIHLSLTCAMNICTAISATFFTYAKRFSIRIRAKRCDD